MAKNKIKFHKNELVKLMIRPERKYDQEISMSRSVTQAELDLWYAELHLDPLDSGGEPRLAPRHTSDMFKPGHLVIIKRGRCTAYIGWHTYAGMAEVVDTVGGFTYFVDRRDIAKITEGAE